MPLGVIDWIKVSTGTFDDQKIKLIRSMPNGDAMVLIWLQLLTEAGKLNEGGVVRLSSGMPYSDDMLATVLGHPLATVRLAINTFSQFGMVSIESDGIWLTNWEKYQNVDGMERVREQARLRKQRQRARLKAAPDTLALPAPAMSRDLSRDVTQQSKSKTTETEIDTTLKSSKREESRDSVTSPLLIELTKLPGWSQSNGNHDADWLSEFLAEYPALSSSVVRACRDYHSEKKKHTKAIWKTRLRHWMEREKSHDNGNGNGRRRPGVPETYSYRPPTYHD